VYFLFVVSFCVCFSIFFCVCFFKSFDPFGGPYFMYMLRPVLKNTIITHNITNHNPIITYRYIILVSDLRKLWRKLYKGDQIKFNNRSSFMIFKECCLWRDNRWMQDTYIIEFHSRVNFFSDISSINILMNNCWKHKNSSWKLFSHLGYLQKKLNIHLLVIQEYHRVKKSQYLHIAFNIGIYNVFFTHAPTKSSLTFYLQNRRWRYW
jgi:hypothetical protein